MQPDLTRLYSLLDLRTDCSLEELQRAYRRRIAELHPDRLEADARTPEARAQLPDLISLYAAATRFHRRHGRLPGAPPSHYVSTNASSLKPPRHVGISRPPAMGDFRDRRPRRGVWIAASLLALLLALLLAGDRSASMGWSIPPAWSPQADWSIPSPPDAPAPVPTAPARDASPIVVMAAPVDSDTVVITASAVQRPSSHAVDRAWNYAPSWSKPERERSVDWYRSPELPVHDSHSLTRDVPAR